jgi:small subunit ribosomal protein S24e
MSVEIISDKKNPLLQRREVEFTASGKTTPSRKELKAELAKALKANEKLIVIDFIDQKMGTNINTGKVKVYDSEEALKKISLGYKTKRDTVEKKKEGDAPAEKTEKPKTEVPKTEAPKAEKK